MLPTTQTNPTPKSSPKPNGKTNDVPEPPSVALANVYISTLDQAVAELKELQKQETANAWAIAVKLTAIHESELWKTRKTDQGQVAYRTFEQFSKTELGITRRYAQDLLKICARFTEEEFRVMGPSKLRLVLVSPEKDQKQLLAEIKAGASKRDIDRRIHPGSKARHLKKLPEEGDIDTGKITVAAVEGRKVVKLFANPTDKDSQENPRPAVSLKDGPWGYLDLANDMRMWFTVIQAPSGELSIRFAFRRPDKRK